MSSRHPRRHKDSKTESNERHPVATLPNGAKGYKKIGLSELPTIDVHSGPIITNIRDAIIQYCQRELGPISQIFIEGRYKSPATAIIDTVSIMKDVTGVLKEQASARNKQSEQMSRMRSTI